ncbi:IS66 family transposase [Hyalangium versicolor]|uniref:IS66 family transposase n=1 Tax=Hyalangium versicolor TaxID=2861190 RepID=UPI001CCDD857|nr:transposase [Hyalangium versicolor]
MPRDPLLTARQGETLTQQLQWLTLFMDPLEPLWRAALDAVLSAPVMHLDSRGLPVVLDDSKPLESKLGSFWVYVGGSTALFVYSPAGKEQDGLGPEKLLARRQGYVVTSCSSRFDFVFQQPSLVPCGCNREVQRLLLRSGDPRATNALNLFQQLYALEDETRGLSPEARLSRRQTQSRPGYDDLVRWCTKLRPDEPPSSPLGRAVHHVLDHEAALRRFLDDGVIPIDNTVIEQLPVRSALVRKPLVASSDAEAQRAAIVCTLWSSCLLAGVEPITYLHDVLERLAHGVPPGSIAELLPSRRRALH